MYCARCLANTGVESFACCFQNFRVDLLNQVFQNMKISITYGGNPGLGFLIILFFVFSLYSPAQDTQGGKLNQVYQVKEVNTGGKTENMPGQQIFITDKTIGSTFSRKNKFPDAKLHFFLDESGKYNVVNFYSDTVKNNQGHSLYWTGKIKNEVVQGSAIRDRKGKSGCTYEFKGNLKK
jgi:hypothetical protein